MDSAEYGDGPVPVATVELPPVPAGFTGRAEDLTRLVAVLDPQAPPVPVRVVSGLGGVGKTSLVLCAAHRAVAAGWFPGGTLFVNLRGYDDDPVTADQALTALLDGLGVRGAELPPTTSARYALYRRLLAERQPVLLVLDNVSHPAQVAPLVPDSDRHRVLVTSRDRLAGLDAGPLGLDVLTPPDAAEVIDRSLRLGEADDDRAAREPEAVAELAALCGRHPLALRMAVGMLRNDRHRTVASLAAELRQADDRVDDLGLRPVIERAFGNLSPVQAWVLRHICLAPTAEMTDMAASALAGLALPQTVEVLAGLASSHLVTRVPTGGETRWRVHDLVREFGARAVAADPRAREEGEAARRRLLEGYTMAANAADDRLRWLPGMPETPPFPTRALALAWLDSERTLLVAAVRWAEEPQFARTAVRLASYLASYLNWRRYFDDWITVARIAREAAHRLGDPVSEAIAWTNLGGVLQQAGRTEEAIDAHVQARDLHRRTGNVQNEAHTWNNLGLCFQQAGRVTEAIEAHSNARDLHERIGNPRYVALSWNNLGLALQAAGRTDEAVDAHVRARELYEVAQDRQGEGTAWHDLALALQKAGRTAEAIEAFGVDVEICREFEDWYGLGHALANLGRAHHIAGHRAESRDHYLRSAEAYTRAGAAEEAAKAQSAADSLT
ncbi:tetratricopeptide repeat protein [Streptomyces flavalbus]|uniref:Tetratricopeptide repeat protein n=1 Tax=Streptomyces flavalbus TaxID=2665155 RepID=A0ABW2WCY4_9ACTN